jgi:transcriptional regulator with XRE-family HTH domain
VTDLRDHLADFDAAARRPIPLTDRRGTGHILWRIRTDTGMTLDGLAHRLGLSRSGVHRREAYGFMPTSALIEHAGALGYRVILEPMHYRPTGTGWPDAGALTPDRRTA